ncbi:MAG: hypothetical protein IPL78_08035 [Chloroflexi bacterium]|nr:hypothetical protein [Chloroflexota bacterium]
MDQTFVTLQQYLRRWDMRRRLAEGLIWVPRGLLAGLLLAALLAGLARLRPLLTNEELGFVTIELGVVGFAAALLYLLLQRRNLIQQARFADAQFALQERASTAVEIQTGRFTVPADLAQRQLQDTVRAAGKVNAKAGLPLRLNRQDWFIMLLALALLAAAVWFPNPQATILQGQRAVQESIEEQIQALEALQEEVIQNPELTEEQKEEILEPIEGAIESLEAGDSSREEAVAVLSEAEADLQALEASNSTEQLQEALESAGQPLAENENAQSLGESLQNGDFSAASAAAAQLADTLPSLTPQEQAELAADLAATAEALAQTDPELAAELSEAAEALENGDVAAAQQALREASGTLQERAQQQAAAQQAAEAAGQVGEGRQEVAQAGEAGQSGQPGETGQPGEGQGEGQGQGQGEGQGQGQGEGDGQGEGQGQGQPGGDGTGQGGPGPGGGHAEDIYVPPYQPLTGEGVDIELPAECVANPAACGGLLSETPSEFGNETSNVPYDQVYGDYRNAANEALSSDYIPLGYKGYIRDYFSSLEP